MPSHASWVYEPGSAAAPKDPTGWKPVQLVPENARPGRGGLPIAVGADENQAIWIEIYIDRERTPGLYRGDDRDPGGQARRTRADRARGLRLHAARREQHARDAVLLERSSRAAITGRNLDRRLPSARSSSSRGAGARVRRADADGSHRPILRGGLHARARLRRAWRGRRQRDRAAKLLRPGPGVRRSLDAPGLAATRG